MSRQPNIVSFDAARRAASGRRMPSYYAQPAPLSMRNAHMGPDSLEARRLAEDDYLEDDELEAPLNPIGRTMSELSRKRKKRVKERAGRAYYRQYEAGKASDASQGGPRAAVYKGEMGSSHRRSSRMQQRAGGTSSGRGFGAPSAKPAFSLRTPLMILGAIAVCLVFGAMFLYGPSQQLYTDIRQRDRLAAEYAAIVDRNAHIEAQVQALSTDEGVADAARTQFGWVREGEHSVSVSGLESYEPADNFRGNIVSADIPYPETWYSGVLDPFFGVE